MFKYMVVTAEEIEKICDLLKPQQRWSNRSIAREGYLNTYLGGVCFTVEPPREVKWDEVVSVNGRNISLKDLKAQLQKDAELRKAADG